MADLPPSTNVTISDSRTAGTIAHMVNTNAPSTTPLNLGLSNMCRKPCSFMNPSRWFRTLAFDTDSMNA